MNRRNFLLSALVGAITSPVTAAKIEDVPKYLTDVSVTIRAGRSEGSGIAFVRDGVTYVWTAAHVVDGLRKTRTVVGGGMPKTVVEFDDAQVVKMLSEKGRIVGRLAIDAEVMKYSDADNGHDLALLRVRKKGFLTTAARFYLDPKLPKIGAPLWHCGSLLGSPGSGSLTTGILSAHGRVISGSKFIFDQATVVAFPGSSGGAVTLADGRVCGMLVRGTSIQGFNLIVPMRRWLKWARANGVDWAIDPAVKMPTAKQLADLPIESAGGKAAKAADMKDFPFLIRRK